MTPIGSLGVALLEGVKLLEYVWCYGRKCVTGFEVIDTQDRPSVSQSLPAAC